MGKIIKDIGKGGGRITSKCNLTGLDPLAFCSGWGVCFQATVNGSIVTDINSERECAYAVLSLGAHSLTGCVSI